jgi:hypothetical protein
MAFKKKRSSYRLFYIDFVEEYKITIDGEIRQPGVYYNEV